MIVNPPGYRYGECRGATPMSEPKPPLDANAAALARINLKLLQTFILVAENRSFKEAADRANRSQSAISMQIKQPSVVSPSPKDDYIRMKAMREAGRLKPVPRRRDVGVDAMDFRPVTLETQLLRRRAGCPRSVSQTPSSTIMVGRSGSVRSESVSERLSRKSTAKPSPSPPRNSPIGVEWRCMGSTTDE